MFLLIKELDKKLLDLSKSFFEKNYPNEKNKKSHESIISRYLLSRLVEDKFWKKDYVFKFDIDWSPIFFDNIYFSISHKKNLVFIWISKKEIWIDIETYKERDLNLLDFFSESNYLKLWRKNRNNFFVLWTAFESIIKKEFVSMENKKNLKLEKIDFIDKSISWIKFDKILTFSFFEKKICVYSLKEGNRFFWVCF